ncbi:toll-like receptor 5 [Pelodytes ibericus]
MLLPSALLLFPLYCLASASLSSHPSNCTSLLSKSRLVYFCQAQGLSSIPSYIPLQTQILLLSFNNIPSVSQQSFPDLLLLQTLSLGAQTTSGSLNVGAAAFHHLPNLTSLDLGGNRNLILHAEAFKGLSKLEILLLDSNGLDESVLESGLFRDLIALQKLDLSFNQIRRLRPDPSFLQLSSISSIHLKLNQIKLISGDDLRNLQGRRLELLDLSSNPLNFNDTNSCTNPFNNITLGILDISSMAWDVKKVENVFKTISGTRVEHVKMKHDALLGSGFGFQNLRDPDENTFSGLNSSRVRILDVSHCFISHLAPRVFSGFPDLLSLDISSNKISRLSPGAFSGMGQLVSLNLSGNLLGEILSNSFQSLGFTSLRALDLSSNNIGPIQYGALDALVSLESLNLRDNALNRIPPVKLSHVTLVLLNQNRITNIYGLHTFSPRATFLDLSSNRLTDLRSLWEILKLSSLKHLLLGKNKLSRCSSATTGGIAIQNNLLSLDLSDNDLGSVWKSEQCGDIFRSLGKLETLNLANNLLISLPHDLFSGLQSLSSLDLSMNHLRHIPNGLFLGLSTLKSLNLGTNNLVTLSHTSLEPLGSLKTIDLSEITFMCDCGLRNVWRWVVANNVTVQIGDHDFLCIQSLPKVMLTSMITFFKNC